ncbi:MAG: hypothetical protein U1E66_14120 [Rhodospirillales bacterium]
MPVMASLLISSVGIFWAVVVGLPLGIVAAILLLWLFRRRVAQSMHEALGRTGGDGHEVGSPVLPAAARSDEDLVIKLTRPAEVLAAAPATSPAVTAKRQAWRVALAYVDSVAVMVLIMVNIVRLFSSLNPPPDRIMFWYFLYFAAFSWVFATPAVLAGTYVIRKQPRYLLLAVIIQLAVIGIWDYFMFKGSLFNLWLWYAAVPAIIALLLATRRLRAVGPVVIVGSAVWSAISIALIFIGSLYALDVLGLHFVRPDLRELSLADAIEKYMAEFGKGSLADLVEAYSSIWSGSAEGRLYTVDHPDRDRAAGLIGLATLLIASIAGAVVAWAAVSWLASRHRRGASDQMFAIDVMVLVFALYIVSVFFVFYVGSGGNSAENGQGTIVISISIIAFIAYKLAVIALLRISRSHPGGPARVLLLLRVFGFDRRTQRLLEDLGQRWRYLGPIRLIAGPDLAYATVEPHEFYDFLSGRLARAFVTGRDDVESRLLSGTTTAALDGLYRIEDFFCHEDTWRMTVSRLARDADAVFMDLRGFSPNNRGCIFEIEQSIAWVPIDRIVLLVDQTTDVPLLRRTLAAAWQHLPGESPNTALNRPVVRILEASRKHRQTLDALMAMLCAPFDAAVREPSKPLPA